MQPKPAPPAMSPGMRKQARADEGRKIEPAPEALEPPQIAWTVPPNDAVSYTLSVLIRGPECAPHR